MSSNWLEEIATDRGLKEMDLRVLLALLAYSQGFSTVEIPQTEIAQKLGLKASHVSRAIRNLCNKGFIEKKRVGRKLVGYHFALGSDESAEPSV